MRRYQSQKIVEAEPMTLGEYNMRKGWKLLSNEDPHKEGYIVVNMDGHWTWSPREIFEKDFVELV